MRWRELLEPLRMERVAVVAPTADFRRVSVAVADAGVVEPERSADGGEAAAALARALVAAPDRAGEREAPVLAFEAPDIATLERENAIRELAGEAELATVLGAALHQGAVTALAGWTPAMAIEPLAARLRALGGAVVRLPVPRASEPPTPVARGGAAATFAPLIQTYATIPYADVNPSLFAGFAYVMMFGMMFGDVGHGALLALAGVVLLRSRKASLRRLRPAAPFVIGAGVTSTAFGFAYGEAFGPTGWVPTLWLAPLERPIPLLAAAVGAGAALLAISYAFGTVNRWREGGFGFALVALSGFAGIGLYVGLALLGFGWFTGRSVLAASGAVLAGCSAIAGFAGLAREAGGHASGVLQAGIELFDAIVRLGTNTLSFARLAAFGLTHAALGGIVWSGTTALAMRGGAWLAGAAVLFVAGNAAAFALEALVAAVQALRLEYYELFSRIFISTGRTFAPWHVPLLRKDL